MRILLTGFGPFGSVLDNPTSRLVAHFEAVGLPGHELTARVLPVSYRRAAEEVEALLRPGKFDLALLLGVAAKAPAIRLELFGRNRSSRRKKDMDEETTLGYVREEGLSQLPAGLSVAGLVERLWAESIPARISLTAGDYVCNHTYYAALDCVIRLRLKTRCLFVHVPSDELAGAGGEGGPMVPYEKQVRAVEIILSSIAAS